MEYNLFRFFGKGYIPLVLSPFPKVKKYFSFLFSEKVIFYWFYHLSRKMNHFHFSLFSRKGDETNGISLFSENPDDYAELNLELNLRT